MSVVAAAVIDGDGRSYCRLSSLPLLLFSVMLFWLLVGFLFVDGVVFLMLCVFVQLIVVVGVVVGVMCVQIYVKSFGIIVSYIIPKYNIPTVVKTTSGS